MSSAVRKCLSVLLLTVGVFSLIGYLSLAVTGSWSAYNKEASGGIFPLEAILSIGIVFVVGGVLLWRQKKWLLLGIVSLLIGAHQTFFFFSYSVFKRCLTNGILFSVAGLALIVMFYKTKAVTAK